MFFENEKKEIVTSLTTNEFKALKAVLNGWCYEGFDNHPSNLDKETIAEGIANVRSAVDRFRSYGMLERFECSDFFDSISDEELSFLIEKYGQLERDVNIVGDVRSYFSHNVVVPMDIPVEELENYVDDDFDQFCTYSEEYMDDAEVEEWSAETGSVSTNLAFDLPTPTEFDVSSELKKAA